MVIRFIKDRMSDSLAHGETVRTKWLQQELRDEYNIVASRGVMSRVLKKLVGARWGRTVVQKADLQTPKAQLRQTFCVKYALARKLQEEGKAFIVWLDETYINTGHHAKDTWFVPGTAMVSQAKGLRLICLHAMTKDDPVVSRDANGKPIVLTDTQSSDLKTVYLTAEMIYQAGKADGDYHDNMDSDTFLAWLEFRLLPTLRSKYPSKRFFFVLDNASYHKEKTGLNGKKWKCWSSMNKEELSEMVTAWDIKSITVNRTGRRANLILPTKDLMLKSLRTGGVTQKDM